MSEVIGIQTRSCVSNAAGVRGDQTFTTNVVLATVGLISTLAAGMTKHVRAWIPITVGATGGVRLQIVVPAGSTVFDASIRLNNTVAPSATIATQLASAAFTNALANAGTHWLDVEFTVKNGVTAGNVDIQLAQNTSDALSLVVLQGGFMESASY